MKIEIKILFFLIFVLFVINISSKEKLSNTNDIKKLIVENYKIDVDAIRNLSKLANDLTLSNSLKVPGGLKVEGPINFLPKGTIVAFNGTTAPKGWAICDGKTVNGYKTPDLRGRFIRMHTSGKVSGVYKKFPMNVRDYAKAKGYSQNNKSTYIAKQNFNEQGGSDFVQLDVKELPAHYHYMNFNRDTNVTGDHNHTPSRTLIGLSTNIGGWPYSGSSCVKKPTKKGGYHWGSNQNPVTDRSCSYPKINNNGRHSHRVNIAGNTRNTGSSQSHNNTPPYYVLTWIVKVV